MCQRHKTIFEHLFQALALQNRLEPTARPLFSYNADNVCFFVYMPPTKLNHEVTYMTVNRDIPDSLTPIIILFHINILDYHGLPRPMRYALAASFCIVVTSFNTDSASLGFKSSIASSIFSKAVSLSVAITFLHWFCFTKALLVSLVRHPNSVCYLTPSRLEGRMPYK